MFPTLFRISLFVCFLQGSIVRSNIDNENINDDNTDPMTEAGEFQGDITFPPGMNIWSYAKPDNNSGSVKTGAQESVISSQHRIWPKGIIPFVVGANFSREERLVIDAAISEFYLKTCIKWVRRSNEEDYVEFKKGKGCSSMVGKIGWRQDIILGHRCFQKGIIIHEMMHVLGFFHEQSRTDRDKYVTILFENIKPWEMDNFEKYSIEEIDDLGTPYDCSSIMHYTSKTFARSRELKTIVPKSEECNFGQQETLSPTDIQDISLLYNCKNSKIPATGCETNNSISSADLNNYTRKYGVRLTSHYREIHTENIEDCWRSCRPLTECHGVTWNYISEGCFLVGPGEHEYKDAEWISYLKGREDHKTLAEGRRLYNHYKKYPDIKTKLGCRFKCLQDINKCGAAAVHSSGCHLFEYGRFTQGHDNGWYSFIFKQLP